MYEPTITMRGNLIADPVQRVTANGARLTQFRIVHNRRKFDEATKDWVNFEAVFMTVKCWRQLGDNAFITLHKGDSVLVHGQLDYREWTDADGKPRSNYEIMATSVAPDLSRYVALLSKPNRPLDDTAADAPAVPAQSAGDEEVEPAA